ncbi:hypothetical protein BKA61DRAFT_673004 [Leptodontidium sp. MPI-SDFR-AT-0119]|nr:hypothetical protein BKA61DRAFT_673004 [Leptodontidium sp. MPI-SDFR-AT-0119]
MSPQMASIMEEDGSTWDVWGGDESGEDDSATPSADTVPQPTPYQSRLPEIDKMLNLQTPKYANKVRHSGQYRAILRATRSQTWDQEWLRNAEMDLWYTHSSDPFPGGLSPKLPDTNGSSHTIQNEVSSSDSDGGGVKLDINWDKGGSFYDSPYVKAHDDSSPDSSPNIGAKVPEQFNDIASREDVEGGTHAEGRPDKADADVLSRVINSALASAVKHVQFDIVMPKPKPPTKPAWGSDKAHGSTQRLAVLAHSLKTTKTSSIRYADMESSSSRAIKVPKCISPSTFGPRVVIPKSSMSNGWVEFREPESTATRTSTSISAADWDNPEALNLQRRSQEDVEAKKEAALSAWAAFPAQAAKEDKADALAHRHLVPSSTPHAAPVIKETFKKVVVSGNRFERKIVGKTVEILE